MTAGNSTILIDANVLVHAHDPRDRRKQERALTVLEGCRGASEHSLSIWDALIWATAKLNQVPVILSEDFVDGAFLEGVRFLNPFAPAFDLALLDVGP